MSEKIFFPVSLFRIIVTRGWNDSSNYITTSSTEKIYGWTDAQESQWLADRIARSGSDFGGGFTEADLLYLDEKGDRYFCIV